VARILGKNVGRVQFSLGDFKMDLKYKINEVLNNGAYCRVRLLDKTYKNKKQMWGFELEYGKMYESPQLNFSELKGLSELFGTDEIDVDNYGSCGCDTCDYGSDYGHTIQIFNPTKNVDEMMRLTGMDLKEED